MAMQTFGLWSDQLHTATNTTGAEMGVWLVRPEQSDAVPANASFSGSMLHQPA
jgi:hypothetical protein